MRLYLWVLVLLFTGRIGQTQDNLRFGTPQCDSPVLNKQFFVICYSGTLKIPLWVGYMLTANDLNGPAPRKDSFRSDTKLPASKRSELKDYAGSGYDRGHMAPAEDFDRSREAMRTSFLLSNMAPQVPTMNRGRWARLEREVRKLASQCDVWIFTGPVFIGNAPIQVIGDNGVAVPTHFYKTVLCVRADDSKEAYAYIMPNISELSAGLDPYVATVDFVEEATGLNFFSAVESAEQEAAESTMTHLP
jgi:endonuclease G, mitochondrial